MVNTNYSSVDITTNYHITENQEFSTNETINQPGNGYIVTSSVTTIIIDNSRFVAAGGGPGGSEGLGHDNRYGFAGGNAITINIGAYVTNFYNYGYLLA